MDKQKVLKIIYDFDGTLTRSKMPKYFFIEECGYKDGTAGKRFSDESNKIMKETGEGKVEVFAKLLLKIIKDNKLNPNITNFTKGVECIEYNNGVANFFNNINSLAKDKNVEIEHYVVTSGFIEYIQSLEIAKYFTKIYGSSFKLDENNDIIDIKSIMISENKIEAIKEISTESYTNVIYIGDGMTDEQAMEFIHNNGGQTIFLYQENEPLDIYKKLNKNNIVDFCVEANYEENKNIFRIINNILEKL